MGPEAIFPTVFYYGAALATIGLLVGGTVAGWGSLGMLVVGLASVAAVMNGWFAPSPHGIFAAGVAFIAVFVIVGIFAVISHLVKRYLANGKRTAV